MGFHAIGNKIAGNAQQNARRERLFIRKSALFAIFFVADSAAKCVSICVRYRKNMIMRAFISLLCLSALLAQAAPECEAPIPGQDRLQSICRSIPELQPLAKNPGNYREIAPGFYLLFFDVGSGIYIFKLALVWYNHVDDTWKLIDTGTVASSNLIKFRHEVKDNRYQVEFLRLRQDADWVRVFSGTLPTPE